MGRSPGVPRPPRGTRGRPTTTRTWRAAVPRQFPERADDFWERRGARASLDDPDSPGGARARVRQWREVERGNCGRRVSVLASSLLRLRLRRCRRCVPSESVRVEGRTGATRTHRFSTRLRRCSLFYPPLSYARTGYFPESNPRRTVAGIIVDRLMPNLGTLCLRAPKTWDQPFRAPTLSTGAASFLPKGGQTELSTALGKVLGGSFNDATVDPSPSPLVPSRHTRTRYRCKNGRAKVKDLSYLTHMCDRQEPFGLGFKVHT